LRGQCAQQSFLRPENRSVKASVLTMLSQSPQMSLTLLLFSIGACAWFAYFRIKEAGNGGSFVSRLAAMVGGAFSVTAALLGYEGIDALGIELSWASLHQPTPMAGGMALLIGIVEEGAKLLPVIVIALFGRRFHRPIDGLFFAACAGLGFATAESAALLLQGELSRSDELARAVAAPITHALFAAPMGLGLGSFLAHGRLRSLGLGFAISATAHGIYDFALAQTGLGHAVAVLVVLALWFWVLVQTSKVPVRLPAALRILQRGLLGAAELPPVAVAENAR
jgi:RsiW-degrading membrane proteinase PrsW (M82 family)